MCVEERQTQTTETARALESTTTPPPPPQCTREQKIGKEREKRQRGSYRVCVVTKRENNSSELHGECV